MGRVFMREAELKQQLNDVRRREFDTCFNASLEQSVEKASFSGDMPTADLEQLQQALQGHENKKIKDLKLHAELANQYYLALLNAMIAYQKKYSDTDFGFTLPNEKCHQWTTDNSLENFLSNIRDNKESLSSSAVGTRVLDSVVDFNGVHQQFEKPRAHANQHNEDPSPSQATAQNSAPAFFNPISNAKDSDSPRSSHKGFDKVDFTIGVLDGFLGTMRPGAYINVGPESSESSSGFIVGAAGALAIETGLASKAAEFAFEVAGKGLLSLMSHVF